MYLVPLNTTFGEDDHAVVLKIDSKSIIGRNSATCNIVLSTKGVSRKHAMITRSGDTFFLEDCGSTNGTHLNRAPVSGRQVISPGDIVEFGVPTCAFTVCQSLMLADRMSFRSSRRVRRELFV